jgi:hypothetical protein
MGARINYVFKANMDQPYIVLYAHWGETTWREDLSAALEAARPRWTDDSYALRIIIDQLTVASRDEETGHGIFLASSEDLAFLDYPIIVDVQAMTVNDESGEHSWDDFIKYNLPSGILSTVGAS